MLCQGCINRSSLPAGLGARGVSSEHVENMENAEKMENMEMFSGSPLRCSPVLQLRCALVLGEPCSGSRRTVLWFSENRAMVLRAPTEICSGSSNIWITRLEPKIFVSLRWEPRPHFVGVCGKSIRRIKRNNCTRCN